MRSMLKIEHELFYKESQCVPFKSPGPLTQRTTETFKAEDIQLQSSL
jgi:hypothetical protein